jgi:hypothetical protein
MNISSAKGDIRPGNAGGLDSLLCQSGVQANHPRFELLLLREKSDHGTVLAQLFAQVGYVQGPWRSSFSHAHCRRLPIAWP